MEPSIRLALLVFFLAVMLYLAIILGMGHYAKKHDWKLNFSIFKWKRNEEPKVETPAVEQKKPEAAAAKETKQDTPDTYQEL